MIFFSAVLNISDQVLNRENLKFLLKNFGLSSLFDVCFVLNPAGTACASSIYDKHGCESDAGKCRWLGETATV